MPIEAALLLLFDKLCIQIRVIISYYSCLTGRGFQDDGRAKRGEAMCCCCLRLHVIRSLSVRHTPRMTTSYASVPQKAVFRAVGVHTDAALLVLTTYVISDPGHHIIYLCLTGRSVQSGGRADGGGSVGAV